ncbi:MAG: hypothetical protein JO213_01085 [Alphaproteobacteria bacterium]|nr:hypothetical protein [Alphaproteobacteria bacterium]
MRYSLIPAALLVALLAGAPRPAAAYDVAQAYPVVPPYPVVPAYPAPQAYPPAPPYPVYQGLPVTDAYPQERGVVCASKYGMRQNYWNAWQAQADGATLLFLGECPAEPNSEGRTR